jgi:hypothetical protein
VDNPRKGLTKQICLRGICRLSEPWQRNPPDAPTVVFWHLKCPLPSYLTRRRGVLQDWGHHAGFWDLRVLLRHKILSCQAPLISYFAAGSYFQGRQIETG